MRVSLFVPSHYTSSLCVSLIIMHASDEMCLSRGLTSRYTYPSPNHHHRHLFKTALTFQDSVPMQSQSLRSSVKLSLYTQCTVGSNTLGINLYPSAIVEYSYTHSDTSLIHSTRGFIDNSHTTRLSLGHC